MLNKIFKPVLLGVIFLLMATLSSCEKSKETTAIIIVKNINGENVINATVTLHQDGQISPQGNTTNPDIKKTQNTDANGRVSFTYDLPAILNIEVLKSNLPCMPCSKDGSGGCSSDVFQKCMQEISVNSVVSTIHNNLKINV